MLPNDRSVEPTSPNAIARRIVRCVQALQLISYHPVSLWWMEIRKALRIENDVVTTGVHDNLALEQLGEIVVAKSHQEYRRYVLFRADNGATLYMLTVLYLDHPLDNRETVARTAALHHIRCLDTLEGAIVDALLYMLPDDPNVIRELLVNVAATCRGIIEAFRLQSPSADSNTAAASAAAAIERALSSV